MAETLFQSKDVSLSFGGVQALKNVSINIKKGEVLGLIGPNGAGKTTFFNCITRFIRPDSGEMYLNGNNLMNKKPHEMAYLGVARTFQNLNLCEDMCLLDNIMLGAHSQLGNPLAAMLSLPSGRKKEKELREKATKVAEAFNLRELLSTNISSLPYGSKKFAEYARAMLSDPSFLLLDEPAAGCNDEETREVANMITHINQEYGTTILVVEHDMALVMNVCHRIYVLDTGQVIAEGTPEEIKNNAKVIEAYLGDDIHAQSN